MLTNMIWESTSSGKSPGREFSGVGISWAILGFYLILGLYFGFAKKFLLAIFK